MNYINISSYYLLGHHLRSRCSLSFEQAFHTEKPVLW